MEALTSLPNPIEKLWTPKSGVAGEGLSQIVQDLLKDIPQVEQPNIFPIEWRGDPSSKLAKLYERSQEQLWVPKKEIDFDKLDPKDFTREQRLGMYYWWKVLSVFDSSGPPAFSKAMTHAYETHEPNEVRNAFHSIEHDEVNHEEVCRRVVSKLWSSSNDWEPQSDLEAMAKRNLGWLEYNGARYWNGYSNAFKKYPLIVLFTSFMYGEVAAASLFKNQSAEATHPVFKQALKKIGQDESRHMAICLAALEKGAPLLSDEQKAMVTKQLRAGFVFLSMILYEPPKEFWVLPPEFLEIHREMEKLAREGGLGVATLDQKKKVWQDATLRIKTIVNNFGIEFPAMPELGITGKEITNISMDDIIPVF